MTTFLTNLLLLLELARIIAGETPGCPLQAKIAVGHVHSRNEVWYGPRHTQRAGLVRSAQLAELP